MGNEKDARELINENLTDEEMQDLMASYKKELAHVYKMASAKKAALVRRNLPYIKAELEKCDQEMREDIEALKHKYGIHYYIENL